MRLFFRVEYNGTNFGGWQRQPDAVTVQETLENAFATVIRKPCVVTGAGRTDAGVHARAQGAHIDIDDSIDICRLQRSINGLLSHDIAVYSMQKVTDTFHARYSAVMRRYRYYFVDRKRPLLSNRVWMLPYDIDWECVEKNLDALHGKHDFRSFRASGFGVVNPVCVVSKVTLEQKDDLKVITIEANRYIYKMVRGIMGTLMEIGRGKITDSLESIILSYDRSMAGQTAPACGLVLDYVKYAEVLDDETI